MATKQLNFSAEEINELLQDVEEQKNNRPTYLLKGNYLNANNSTIATDRKSVV